jgi:hypothetical protein
MTRFAFAGKCAFAGLVDPPNAEVTWEAIEEKANHPKPHEDA